MSDEVELDEERKNRYLDKLDTLEDRLEDIDAWLQDSDDQLLENKERRRALYKTFQDAAEVVADVAAMYLSDTGRGIGDDDSNIEKVAGRLVAEDLERPLVKANGLRNRIVHDYNGFDDGQALTSVRDHIDAMKRFRTEVSQWIETR